MNKDKLVGEFIGDLLGITDGSISHFSSVSGNKTFIKVDLEKGDIPKMFDRGWTKLPAGTCEDCVGKVEENVQIKVGDKVKVNVDWEIVNSREDKISGEKLYILSPFSNLGYRRPKEMNFLAEDIELVEPAKAEEREPEFNYINHLLGKLERLAGELKKEIVKELGL